jgi:hypothetical protein
MYVSPMGLQRFQAIFTLKWAGKKKGAIGSL